MDKLKNPYTLAAVVLLAIFTAWTFWPKPTPEVGQSALLPPAKEVIHTEKIITKIEYVKVYPKEVKPKLDLPEAVQKDDAKQVIATGKLKAEERDYTISSVLDTKTGEAEVYARPDPLPWIGPGRQGAVGVGYGVKNGTPAGWVQARHDLIQVKALHGGVMGMVFTDADWLAGGYVEWRF